MLRRNKVDGYQWFWGVSLHATCIMNKDVKCSHYLLFYLNDLGQIYTTTDQQQVLVLYSIFIYHTNKP